MANSIVTLSSAPANLLPGAMGMMMTYELYLNEWKELYTVINSNKKTEFYYEYEALNGAGEFPDGSPIPIGSSRQVFTTYGDNRNYGVGFVITANMLEDNLYPDQFPKGILGIKENLITFQEYKGVAPFDHAFAPQTDPQYLLGDGQTLCSPNHPINEGVISNQLQSAQLSLTSYQDLIVLVQQFQDYSGQPRKILPMHLFSGIPNQFMMSVVTGSVYDPTSANNAINPVVGGPGGDYIHGKYVVSHFMSNPYNYFMLTDYEDGAIFQRRKSLEIQMMTDQTNRNVSCYGNERYCFVFPNFRCVAGVQSYS